MVGLPDQYGLLQAPQQSGLLGINQRLQGLATNPIFNMGIGMLGSQSPHFSGALADGGRQLQQGVMLDERMKDGSANRNYREEMLKMAKQRSTKDQTLTTAINNARFMFPNDPVRQQQAVEAQIFKQNSAQPPASLQEMQWLTDPARTPQELETYWQNKRATRNVTIGGVPTDLPNGPNAAPKPLSSLPTEIDAKRQIAEAARTGQIEAESNASATNELPKVEDKATQALDLLDKIENHPGLSAVIGAPNPLKGGFGVFNMPGSKAADFQTFLDQIGGQIFLDAYQGLKGGGQITEIEGEQAQKSIARMSSAQSEGAFKEALEDYRTIIKKGLNRARTAANAPIPEPVRPTYDKSSMKSKYGLQ